MSKLKRLYMRSSWYPVFNFRNDAGKARSALLATIIPQAIVSGFTGGTFYTGLLIGHGINIVNISILTMIPYIASLFTIFTPYVLERFPKRRVILSVARIAYYLINIIGITLLPQLVHEEGARVTGLIIIIFASYAINFLFNGYSPWHMPYITADVRNTYYTAQTLVSNITSSVVMLIASSVLDSIPEDSRLGFITTLRYVSFFIALLDVYLLQVPKEPSYLASTDRPKLVDIFRRPLQDKRFRITVLVLGLYQLFAGLPSSALSAWLLDKVKVSYLYITVVDATFFLFVLFTSRIWNKFLWKFGACKTMIAVLISETLAVGAYAFVNHSNYLWLMTLVRFTQHFFSMAWSFGTNHIYYETMPPRDQTAHTSFYTLSQHLMVFLGMSIGTWVISAMGDSTVTVFGQILTSVPVLQLAKAILLLLLAGFIFLLRKRLDTPREDTVAAEEAA